MLRSWPAPVPVTHAPASGHLPALSRGWAAWAHTCVDVQPLLGTHEMYSLPDNKRGKLQQALHAETRPPVPVETTGTALALHLDPCSGNVLSTEACTKAHPTYLEVCPTPWLNCASICACCMAIVPGISGSMQDGCQALSVLTKFRIAAVACDAQGSAWLVARSRLVQNHCKCL